MPHVFGLYIANEIKNSLRSSKIQIKTARKIMVITVNIAFFSCSVQLYLVCAMGPLTYTNEWAVKVRSGSDRANKIAAKHEFQNHGLVRQQSECASCCGNDGLFVFYTGGRVK